MNRIPVNYWGLVVVLVLSLFAVNPLFEPGFFPMHDDTQVVRVFEMGQALKDGHFPVRWVKDLGYGYGYPLFNFYAPLPYYVGSFVNLLGFDPLISTKAMMVIGILLSGVFMYFLARAFWGEVGGVVSGLFYVYTPYHAVDVYIRGAVGEYFAMAFIPLVFYGLWKARKEQKWKWVAIGAAGFAGIITSHNLTALMVTPFILLTIFLLGYTAYKNKKALVTYHLSLITIFGLGLSAFYWVPVLLEMGYTNVLSQVGGGANFRDHFVCWQQLWESPWGFGGSVPGCIDGLSLKIGKIHIIAVFLSMFFAKKLYSNNTYHYSEKFSIVFLAFLGFVVSVFLTLEPSKVIWERLSPMAFLQYPWRFLLLASFSSSILAGAIVGYSRHLNTVLYLSMSVALIAILLLFNIKLFQPQTIFPAVAEDYINEEHIKWTTSKISDEFMPKEFKKPVRKEDVAKARITSGEVTLDKTQKLVFNVNNKTEENVLINIAPFPSWKVSLDGRAIDYKATDRGIKVAIPEGKREVSVSFASTPVQLFGNILSAISCLILFGGILLRKTR